MTPCTLFHFDGGAMVNFSWPFKAAPKLYAHTHIIRSQTHHQRRRRKNPCTHTNKTDEFLIDLPPNRAYLTIHSECYTLPQWLFFSFHWGRFLRHAEFVWSCKTTTTAVWQRSIFCVCVRVCGGPTTMTAIMNVNYHVSIGEFSRLAQLGWGMTSVRTPWEVCRVYVEWLKKNMKKGKK